jgi:DNA-binding FrmR family transcriptional regulator
MNMTEISNIIQKEISSQFIKIKSFIIEFIKYLNINIISLSNEIKKINMNSSSSDLSQKMEKFKEFLNSKMESISFNENDFSEKQYDFQSVLENINSKFDRIEKMNNLPEIKKLFINYNDINNKILEGINNLNSEISLNKSSFFSVLEKKINNIKEMNEKENPKELYKKLIMKVKEKMSELGLNVLEDNLKKNTKEFLEKKDNFQEKEDLNELIDYIIKKNSE